MKASVPFLLALTLGGIAFGSGAFAATSGTSVVNFAATAMSSVTVTTPTLSLAPSATDYDNDYTEATGIAGIQVSVRSNSSTGMALLVKCADATPQIALADLLVRTGTAAGTGGTSISTCSAITAVNQSLWTSGVAQTRWKTVATDVKIKNINSYTDLGTAGTTSYANTFTFSVIVL